MDTRLPVPLLTGVTVKPPTDTCAWTLARPAIKNAESITAKNFISYS